MTANEAVTFYLEQKRLNNMSKVDIKKALAEDFNPEDAEVIFIEIMDLELIAVKNQKSTFVRILESKFVSYFFIVFGLIVIGTSIYINTIDQSDINKYLPWVMIFGAAFIIAKHIRNIRKV